MDGSMDEHKNEKSAELSAEIAQPGSNKVDDKATKADSTLSKNLFRLNCKLKKISNYSSALSPSEHTSKKQRVYSTGQVTTIICLVMATFLILSCLIRTDAVQSRLTRLRASLTSNLDEKIALYQTSMEQEPNEAACKGLFETYLARGNASGVLDYKYILESEYDQSDWVAEKLADYTPQPPVPDTEAGTFTQDFSVSFCMDQSLPEHQQFDQQLHLLVSPEAEVNQHTITFSANGTYTVTAYTTNALNLQSELVEYTYVLEKLIPNPVSLELPSGYYSEPITITLSQDQGLPVYYTLDGSEVTTGAHQYTGPIVLEKGSMDIRVAAYSDVGSGTFGDEITCYYHITPWTSSTENEDMLVTGRGTIIKSSSGFTWSLEGTHVLELQIPYEPEAFCEYDNGILYTSGTTIYLLNIHTGESTLWMEAPAQFDTMIRNGNRIYALSSNGQVYYMDETVAWTPIAQNIKLICPQEDGTQLFMAGDTVLQSLNTATLECTDILNIADGISDMAYGGGNLFYTTRAGDCFQYILSDGTNTLLFAHTEDTEVSASHGFNDGYRIESGTICLRVMVANGRVYVKQYSYTTSTTIPWSPFRDSEVSTSSSDDWIIYNFTTNTQETTIKEQSTLMIGDGYYMNGSEAIYQ